MVPNKALHEATTKLDRLWQDKVRRLVLGTRQWMQKNSGCEQEKEIYECHTICTALSWYYSELKLVNGLFLGPNLMEHEGRKSVSFAVCEHSWLQTPDQAILDPYPPGFITLDTVLVPTKGEYRYFAGTQYCPDEEFKFEISRQEIERKAKILLEVLRLVTPV